MIELTTLDRIPLLAGLNEAARRELSLRAVLAAYAPGEVIWSAGAAPRGLLVVLEGEVRVVRSTGGRQHVVHVERAGGTLGDVPMFAGGTYPATAIASRRTRCAVVSRDALYAALREDPELAFELLRRLADRVRHLVDRLDRLAAQSVPSRLAALLLARWEAAGRSEFGLGGTQAAAAEELGTAREVVVRGLRRLAADGLIASAGRGRFRVLDEAGLRRLAESREGRLRRPPPTATLPGFGG